ncbi:MAG: TMEM165/GDT1 family protein [Caulobacter sp.]|nr:TMEM165/GDT1 family protein [Caulobacter sp.]
MQAFLVSTGLVAVAEIGDKTQLLAILLAARFRRPWPIIAGILVATLANHALAALVGQIAAQWLDGPWIHWVLGVAFLGFAVWALIPDKIDEEEADPTLRAESIFLTTAIAFFLVEMGDKTQVATIGLGARFQNVLEVAAGTTLGMMIANVPAVLLGEAAATTLPLKYIRWAAAAGFAAVGFWVLLAG